MQKQSGIWSFEVQLPKRLIEIVSNYLNSNVFSRFCLGTRVHVSICRGHIPVRMSHVGTLRQNVRYKQSRASPCRLPICTVNRFIRSGAPTQKRIWRHHPVIKTHPLPPTETVLTTGATPFLCLPLLAAEAHQIDAPIHPLSCQHYSPRTIPSTQPTCLILRDQQQATFTCAVHCVVWLLESEKLESAGKLIAFLWFCLLNFLGSTYITLSNLLSIYFEFALYVANGPFQIFLPLPADQAVPSTVTRTD